MSMSTHRTSGRPSLRHAAIALGVTSLLFAACGGGLATDAADTTTASGSTNAPASSTTTMQTTETTVDGAVATIVPPLDLADTSWVITHYTEPGGAFTNTLGDATLDFGADGTVTGSTGCNEFAGTWETTGPYYDYDEGAEAFEDKIDSQPLTIAVEATTSVTCDGFLGEQDTDVLADLNGTEVWFIGSTFGDEEAGITLFGTDTRVFADPA